MSAPITPQTNSSRRWWAFLMAVLIVAIGLGGWLVVNNRLNPPAKVDREAACRANNRGLGLMERYEYAVAVPAFEEVVRLDPNWRQGKINLAIALFNANRPGDLERSGQLFAEVLRDEPENPYAHTGLGLIDQYKHQ